MDTPHIKKHISIVQVLEAGSQYEAYLLIEQDLIPDLNVTDQKGITPLIRSIIRGYNNLVKLLIRKNANVNKANLRKMTPLMYAVFSGNFDICVLLVKNGANINALDENENTALIFAVMTNQLSVVDFFIKKGANIYLTNADGRSAFDIAKKHGSCPIVYLLLREMTLQEKNNLRIINYDHNILIKNFTASLKKNSQKFYNSLMPTRYIYPSSTFYLLHRELIHYIVTLLALIQDYDIWYEPYLERDLKLTFDFIKSHKKVPPIIFCESTRLFK